MKWYRYHDRFPHMATLETPCEAPPSWFGCPNSEWHRTPEQALESRLCALRVPIVSGNNQVALARKVLDDFERAARLQGLLPAETEQGGRT